MHIKEPIFLFSSHFESILLGFKPLNFGSLPFSCIYVISQDTRKPYSTNHIIDPVDANEKIIFELCSSD